MGFKKLGKIFQGLFLKILVKTDQNWPFWPIAKKWKFLAFFPRTSHQIFLIFAQSIIYGVEKMKISLFGEIRKCPLLATIDPYLAISRLITRFQHIYRQKSWKIIFYVTFSKLRKNILGGKIHFLLWWLMTPLAPHLEIFRNS